LDIDKPSLYLAKLRPLIKSPLSEQVISQLGKNKHHTSENLIDSYTKEYNFDNKKKSKESENFSSGNPLGLRHVSNTPYRF